MDGVLIDSEKVVYGCMKKIADNLFLDFDESFYELLLGCNDKKTEEVLFNKYHSKETIKKLLDGYYPLIANEYQNNNIHLKPGCRQILEYLSVNNIPYALATGSSYEYVEKDFLQNGFQTIPFKYIVTGDQIQNSKPDPEIFLKAAALMNADIKKCLIIEDSPKGLEAAKRAGAVSCFVPDMVKARRDMVEKATYTRNNLFEVIDLISELKDI